MSIDPYTYRRPGTPTPGIPGQPSASRGWGGWVVFAGLMTMLLGLYHGGTGLVALFRKDAYGAGPAGAAISTNLTTWGWLHIAIGIVLIAAGASLLNSGSTWSRVIVVIAALAQILVEFVYLSVTPVWSLTAIVLSILAVYAVVVHGRDEVAPPPV